MRAGVQQTVTARSDHPSLPGTDALGAEARRCTDGHGLPASGRGLTNPSALRHRELGE